MYEESPLTGNSKAQISYNLVSKKRLILFLSVDIIGSTRYKHQRPEENSGYWVQTINAFYNDFTKYFHDALADEIRKKRILGNPGSQVRQGLGLKPYPWKILGDEIIYAFELNHHKHVVFYLMAFKKAVLEYHKIIQSATIEKLERGLGLKATGWLAGFPVGNTVIIKRFFRQNEQIIPELDFIGPLIDIGFRLSRFSSHRRFIVSVDLALMLSEVPSGNLEFYYDGKQTLKGVLNDRAYPLIWIRMAEDEFPGEKRLRKKCYHDELKSFCYDYIVSRGKPLRIPFIDGDEVFFEPAEYTPEYKRICSMLSDIHLGDTTSYEVK